MSGSRRVVPGPGCGSGNSIAVSPETPTLDTLISSVRACAVGSTKLNSDTLRSIATSVLDVRANSMTLAQASVAMATEGMAHRRRERAAAASATSTSRVRRPSDSSRSAGTCPFVRNASAAASCVCAASSARRASASARGRAIGVIDPVRERGGTAREERRTNLDVINARIAQVAEPDAHGALGRIKPVAQGLALLDEAGRTSARTHRREADINLLELDDRKQHEVVDSGAARWMMLPYAKREVDITVDASDWITRPTEHADIRPWDVLRSEDIGMPAVHRGLG